jgi:hypothetical protein
MQLSTWSQRLLGRGYARHSLTKFALAKPGELNISDSADVWNGTERWMHPALLPTCNGSAPFRMTPCVARRSQFARVKFIPKVSRDARSILFTDPAMTLSLF